MCSRGSAYLLDDGENPRLRIVVSVGANALVFARQYVCRDRTNNLGSNGVIAPPDRLCPCSRRLCRLSSGRTADLRAPEAPPRPGSSSGQLEAPFGLRGFAFGRRRWRRKRSPVWWCDWAFFFFFCGPGFEGCAAAGGHMGRG